MSITVSVVCEDCKEHIWVGQRDYIYKGEEHIIRLESFLFRHQSSFSPEDPVHTLRFVDEHYLYSLGDDWPLGEFDEGEEKPHI